MAWAIIPSKGKHAPCNPPSCKHVDCADAIKTIRAECHLCHDSIGMDKKFTNDDQGRTVHFLCLLRDVEG